MIFKGLQVIGTQVREVLPLQHDSLFAHMQIVFDMKAKP